MTWAVSTAAFKALVLDEKAAGPAHRWLRKPSGDVDMGGAGKSPTTMCNAVSSGNRHGIAGQFPPLPARMGETITATTGLSALCFDGVTDVR